MRVVIITATNTSFETPPRAWGRPLCVWLVTGAFGEIGEAPKKEGMLFARRSLSNLRFFARLSRMGHYSNEHNDIKQYDEGNHNFQEARNRLVHSFSEFIQQTKRNKEENASHNKKASRMPGYPGGDEDESRGYH